MTRAIVASLAPRDSTAVATCPLCHTEDRSTTAQHLSTGAGWRCVVCGQQWDTQRLATVAASAAWVARRRGSDTPADTVKR